MIFSFVLGLSLGIAITILVKNANDIETIKEFEDMYKDKVERIDYLKNENRKLHDTVTDLQIKLVEKKGQST